MAVLSLRDFPDELLARLKSEAALYQKTLREYCVLLLSDGKFEPEPAFRLKMIDTVEEAREFGLKILSGCRKCKCELTNKRCMNSQCVLFNREQ